MNRIHIVGRKNSGKTTLIVELVQWLTEHGYRVGTIKHTHHHHELDTPGKDSHSHREAGANAVGILSPAMNAIFWPNPQHDVADKTAASEEGMDLQSEAKYKQFASLMDQSDLVLVEGDSKTKATKIEVWRAENNTAAMVTQYDDFAAVVTDDELSTELPVLRRSDVPELASWILRQAGVTSR